MSSQHVVSAASPFSYHKLKRSTSQVFWLSMFLSVAVHAAVFTIPHFERTVPVAAFDEQLLTLIEAVDFSVPTTLPRLASIAPLQLPALPSIGDVMDLSIDVPDYRVGTALFEVAPPPASTVDAEKLEDYTHFMPSMVAPRLKNQPRIQRELERRYPPYMRDAGIEGRVELLMWIDEHGKVQKYAIKKSTGSEAFDRAVEEVIPLMDLSPTLKNGRPVRAVVYLPIVFRVRN